jgi:hypothetical protein
MAPRSKTRLAKLVKSKSFFDNLKIYNDPLVRIPDTLHNRMQCLSLHTNILSLEPVHESSDGKSNMPPLMDFLPELAQRSPALESALRALYLIHMGVNKKDDRLVKESALVNTQAMAKVRLATINPKTSTKIETLAASICLYLYEVSPPSDVESGEGTDTIASKSHARAKESASGGSCSKEHLSLSNSEALPLTRISQIIISSSGYSGMMQ